MLLIRAGVYRRCTLPALQALQRVVEGGGDWAPIAARAGARAPDAPRQHGAPWQQHGHQQGWRQYQHGGGAGGRRGWGGAAAAAGPAGAALAALAAAALAPVAAQAAAAEGKDDPAEDGVEAGNRKVLSLDVRRRIFFK
jgi:hypothetical protein